MITLTDDQREVLAHMVVNPDKWVVEAIEGRKHHMAQTFARLSPEAQEKIAVAQVQADLVAKVESRRAEYEAAKASEGTNYLTRAQRQEIEDEKRRAEAQRELEISRERVQAERKALRDEIIAEIRGTEGLNR